MQSTSLPAPPSENHIGNTVVDTVAGAMAIPLALKSTVLVQEGGYSSRIAVVQPGADANVVPASSVAAWRS
ncbi:MAG: hypothetical protein M0Z71_10735, partial [Nitrospiraceae bacterium]|nr:hypothetical protein [Nitrospiraceae bacterium]